MEVNSVNKSDSVKKIEKKSIPKRKNLFTMFNSTFSFLFFSFNFSQKFSQLMLLSFNLMYLKKFDSFSTSLPVPITK